MPAVWSIDLRVTVNRTMVNAGPNVPFWRT
jgi:hypothetical protein